MGVLVWPLFGHQPFVQLLFVLFLEKATMNNGLRVSPTTGDCQSQIQ